MSTRRDFLQRTVGVAAAALPLGQSAAAADSQFEPKGRTKVDATDNYAQRLEAARVATGITGASFAYWDGRALHTAVSGLRNSVTRDPVTVDTVMHVGSITKVMNAALMMQLVDDGVIALADPVLKHLPELRLRDMQALQRITCGMLVNHTSGIDGEWLPEYGPDRERIVDAVKRCADLGQLYAPGEATSYCNLATVIAGHMTERLRGKSWYTLMKTRIYEPLGMHHALVDPLEVPRFRASIGDLTDVATGKFVQTTRPFLAPSFAPAGSTQMTTAADLVMFARAMINGGVGVNGTRILADASSKRMMEPTAEFVAIGTSVLKVGLGWMISAGGVLGHGGGGPGVRSQLYAHPASGRALALLTNCDKGEALKSAFLDPILESWTGIKHSRPHRLKGQVDPRPYQGTYENNADRYIVTAREGGLALRTADKLSTFDNSNQQRPAAALYPVGNDTFEGMTATGSELAIRFVRPDVRGQMRFLASGDRLLARSR
ncbi:serine hydrolase domain-containing protein [Peristeroidobacter soli]|uniref:serine hydrolase domain-containing protein n=1 Tax=Peristeroidobacter soli TaxID=2497877 RepID=UPI00101D7F79|nr:serine hydrolase domain-containing protein [Peristeroidobacter soli]